MKNKLTKDWLVAAAIRALRTFFQTLASLYTVGMALSDINWRHAFSVSAMAALYSLVTSLTGLPEAGGDGTLLIDTTDPNKDIYRLELDTLDGLEKKKSVILKVRSNTNVE